MYLILSIPYDCYFLLNYSFIGLTIIHLSSQFLLELTYITIFLTNGLL